MQPHLRVPYTQQFTPEVTPLRPLLGILRQHQGKRDALKKAIASAFFGDTKSPDSMAGNTMIALKTHGLIDDGGALTQMANEMLSAQPAERAVEYIARNILMSLDGMMLVETLREMKQGNAPRTLDSIKDELRLRGFDLNENSSDLSGVLNWLRAAGVLTKYDVNEDRYAELVGVTPAVLTALKELTEPQVAFLHAMVALGVKDFTPHNMIVQHAEALYSGMVSYNWKELDRTILKPLVAADFIEFQKAPKSTEGARGGKAAAVKPTEKFEREVAIPILTPIYKAAGFRDLRKIRSIPLEDLVATVRRPGNDNARAEALEFLAIRICQLLDLSFLGWRETDEEMVAGGEVDGFMHTARLVYSRWQIQCKASDKITYENIAKEVGVAEVTLANVILIVSTGVMTTGAATYRTRIIKKNPLNIVVIDGAALDTIVKNPAAITSILHTQAMDAMRLKPKPNHLVRETKSEVPGGEDDNDGADPAPEAEAPAVPKAAPKVDQPTLFSPYYSTEKGSLYLGDSYEVLRQLIDEGVRVKLLFTSPPFALIKKKAYGNEDQERYLDWFMRFTPLFHQILEPDGSFVMDIGGTWIPGIPARSIYQYKLLLKLCESDFYLAQEFYHYNPARLPTPAEWVTVRRLRVKDAMNHVWWFVKDPFVDADNRRVLREYSDSMKSLLKNGYQAKMRPSGHDISEKFTSDNGGSIPPNLLEFANTESNSHYLRECKRHNIAPHPARFPSGLPDFFIRFLTQPGDLILDPFAGSNVTGEVAEQLGRRWIGCEITEEYARGSKFRFDKPPAEAQLPLGEELMEREIPPTHPQLLFLRGQGETNSGYDYLAE